MDFICRYKVISQVAIKPSYTTDGVVTYGTEGLSRMLDEKHVGDGLNSVSETQALSHSGCGCCGNIFAECVGRHGNNRNSGCVRVIRGTADRRCCLISVHHRHLDVHQDDVIGSGREGEDLNMSTAICPFSAQLTDNPCVLRSSSAISRFSSLSSASRTLYPWCRTVFEYLRRGRDSVRQ